MAKDRSYEVGYGKPPRHTQYRKGTSGFEGRKHKPRATLSDQFDRILGEKVRVTDGGRVQRLTKQEIFLRQLVARGISGTRQCDKLLLTYLMQRQDRPDATHANDTDEFLMNELAALLNRDGSGDGNDGE